MEVSSQYAVGKWAVSATNPPPILADVISVLAFVNNISLGKGGGPVEMQTRAGG